MTGKEKILQAAMALVREKGYEATTVDDLCTTAGVTKGAFFHYFDSKEALGVAAAKHWTEKTREFFADAPYQKLADPREKLLGYIDYRIALLKGELPEFTCLVGTMVQETYGSNPAIRDACRASIFGHAGEVAGIIKEAKAKYAPRASWTPESLGLYTQAAIQGAFILAKADDSAARAADAVRHLRRYIGLLLHDPKTLKETV